MLYPARTILNASKQQTRRPHGRLCDEHRQLPPTESRRRRPYKSRSEGTVTSVTPATLGCSVSASQACRRWDDVWPVLGLLEVGSAIVAAGLGSLRAGGIGGACVACAAGSLGPGANAIWPNRDGDAIVTWERLGVIQARVRSARGSFSARVDLSAPGQNVAVPQVAMNQAGDSVVVWQGFDGTNSVVQAAVRPGEIPVPAGAHAFHTWPSPVVIELAGYPLAGPANRAAIACIYAGEPPRLAERAECIGHTVAGCQRPCSDTSKMVVLSNQNHV